MLVVPTPGIITAMLVSSEKQGRDSQSGEWIELGAGRLLLVSLPLALLRMDGNHSKRDRQLAI